MREGTLTLPDGRRIGYRESGVPDGRPVFFFHGLPGSRRQRHPDDTIAAVAGARVVQLERPGIGWSSPQPGRRLLDWPRDVAGCADALGFGRFAIAGISGGGPYAMACAHVLGERLTRTAIVSGVGPPGSMPRGMTRLARLGFALAPRWPRTVHAAFAPLAQLAMHAPNRYLDHIAAHMDPVDRPILARPAVRAMFAEDYREAFAQGVRPFVQDLAVVAAPWGFAPQAVAAPLALWHGEADRLVPASATRFLAGAVAGAQAHFFPGEGHFMIFDRWREVLAWLTTE